MEEIRRKIDELAKMVKERKGACIIFVDPDGDGKNVQLLNEGYMKALASMIGTAVLTDDDMKEYITRGVEAALFVENEKKKKNDKADC